MNKCDAGITNPTSAQITQKQDRRESRPLSSLFMWFIHLIQRKRVSDSKQSKYGLRQHLHQSLSGFSNLPVCQWCSGELHIITNTNIYFPVLLKASLKRFLLQVLESSYCTPSCRSPLFGVHVGPASLGKVRPERSHTHAIHTGKANAHSVWIPVHQSASHTLIW